MTAPAREPGELVATLHGPSVPRLERHALNRLVATLGDGSALGAFLRSIVNAIDAGETIHLVAVTPERGGEWDGFETQRDLLAATVYNARAQSRREMTPERWARVKRDFRGSAEQCLEQADAELADQ